VARSRGAAASEQVIRFVWSKRARGLRVLILGRSSDSSSAGPTEGRGGRCSSAGAWLRDRPELQLQQQQANLETATLVPVCLPVWYPVCQLLLQNRELQN
jgi:hypothetical protein